MFCCFIFDIHEFHYFKLRIFSEINLKIVIEYCNIMFFILYSLHFFFSITIQKLESDLGVAVFDRSTHRARLTSIGKMILQEGSQILRSANDLEQMIKRFQIGWEEEII